MTSLFNLVRSFLTLGAATLPIIASVVGIGAGAESMFGGGGGGGGGGGSRTYVPTGLGGADTAWQQFLQNYAQQAGQQGQQISPYLSGAFQQAAGQAPQIAQQYGQLAGMTPQLMQMLLGQAGTAGGAQQQLMGAGGQLWQNALDPQNALRNQLMQQVQDTSRAGTSMRGIGMGAESAGLENQAMNNFLNQWQNQQLGRQAQGLQGMTGAFGQAGQLGQQVGRDITGALGIGAMGPQFMQQGAQYPFDIANAYSGAMGQGVYNPMLGGMGAIIPYLNQGLGATGQLFGQQQTGLANLTRGLGDLGRIFSGGGGGGSGYINQPYNPGYDTGGITGPYDPTGQYG